MSRVVALPGLAAERAFGYSSEQALGKSISIIMPAGSVTTLITAFRAIRPEVRVVITAAANRRRDFSVLGVERCLKRDWAIADLIEVLKY